MRVEIQPPLAAWLTAEPARGSVLHELRGASRVPGLPSLEKSSRVVLTGHQPGLWHPGIVAKYMALAAAGDRLGAQPVHLVVDTDLPEAVDLELPVQDGDRLSIERVALGARQMRVPMACQPPMESAGARRVLNEARDRLGARLAVDVQPIVGAFADLPEVHTLGQQLAVVASRLMGTYVAGAPVVFASELSGLPGFGALVARMAEEARRCAECYNQAIELDPGAGIAPLDVGAQRVELPLWRLRRLKPRGRVYVDLTGATPRLVTETGREIEADAKELAPRALLLTGFLRAECCDLFIHGRGGYRYDLLTERWWQAWRGESLAPMAKVSADMRLLLHGPVSTADEAAQAAWWAHHLPHNLDRRLGLDGPEVERKRALLATMNEDRDRRRRAAVFEEIHRINDELVQRHADVIRRAKRQLEQAKIGMGNWAVAVKRDWCFAFYHREQMRAMAAEIRRSAVAGGSASSNTFTN